MAKAEVEITLEAVIVAVTNNTPRLLTVDSAAGFPALPSGLLKDSDRTIEEALRRWVREQTASELGYVEQLYTFGDRDRVSLQGDGTSRRLLSIAYLALVREEHPAPGARWVDFYDFFPWEDHREGGPKVVEETILPCLYGFSRELSGEDRSVFEERVQIIFGDGSDSFDGVRVLERYELLYEARLLSEGEVSVDRDFFGRVMHLDHRRIAATALGRLRGKLTYRPVVFELLSERFTLLQLQRVVEALSGVQVHKQNFRRLVESAGLVQGTDDFAATRGRPAELFEFRREVLRERPRPGVR